MVIYLKFFSARKNLAKISVDVTLHYQGPRPDIEFEIWYFCSIIILLAQNTMGLIGQNLWRHCYIYVY